MTIMLDTNICIYIMKKKPETVLNQLKKYEKGEICISAITLAELEYGVSKSSSPSKNQLALTIFLSGISVLPFDEKASVEYGNIRAELEKQGKPIVANDLLIVAHARSLNFTLITNNTKEFNRANGLKVENWV